ncbi:MAG: helix-turn-helix transcriptional regulator [Chloroflexota bacterium]|nr:helix-turn-helix transcriptional regulator [Chloroflexota bacterium]
MEQTLLGFLMQEPMHGYNLHQRVEAELGEIWYMGISNVYSALKRLERSGRVESTLVPQEGNPSRKVYTITPAGERSFLGWLHRSISTMRRIRVEFPAKLYFFRALGLEGMQDLIAAQETTCQERVERLEQKTAPGSPHDINRLVFDFRRRQIEAIIGWFQFCREEWLSSPTGREP